MNIRDLNRVAWDHAAREGNNPYTQAVSAEQVAGAVAGRWSLYLSDCKPVPRDWFPVLRGAKVLCLASGGGQQAPIFAALGAEVTLLDASAVQLGRDRYVAERDNLHIDFVQGDMADLVAFADSSFDLIFNPPSTLFVPDLQPIWYGCHRTLKKGGLLMTGFMNPDEFIFDATVLDVKRALVVKHSLPYVEHDALSQEELADRRRKKAMFHFSHTMEAQLGGLLKAGFVIMGFYEDHRHEADGNPLRYYMPSFYVVNARKQQPRQANAHSLDATKFSRWNSGQRRGTGVRKTTSAHWQMWSPAMNL